MASPAFTATLSLTLTCIHSHLGLNHGIQDPRRHEEQSGVCPCSGQAVLPARRPSIHEARRCPARGLRLVHLSQLPQPHFAVLASAYEKRLVVRAGFAAGLG